MSARALLLVVAAALVVAPVSPAVVERVYANGVYPRLQSVLTAASNHISWALFDALIVGVTTVWLALLASDLRRPTLGRWAVWRGAIVRTATTIAALYVVFLMTWGLHYRRVPLETRLRADLTRLTSQAHVELATTAASELNRLSQAPRQPLATGAIDPSLARAFEDAQLALGSRRLAVPGRPKRSLLLEWYFRRAGVDGMTNPYLLETMVLSDVLPVERPMVVAHEWAHLAGYANEGDANFVGWLTCLHGSNAAQYSAWLFLYSDTVRGLPEAAWNRVGATLGLGPRADLQAIRHRLIASVSPAVSNAGWQIYDRYLKANRVERGTDSYADVVRLVLGTPLGSATIERARRAQADPGIAESIER